MKIKIVFNDGKVDTDLIEEINGYDTKDGFLILYKTGSQEGYPAERIKSFRTLRREEE